ncbi:MAG: hypothetical protein JO143_06220 [Acetobacteraceae bacterium]|nr:hypothetical protein [Acetobacteraceae bacterium]
MNSMVGLDDPNLSVTGAAAGRRAGGPREGRVSRLLRVVVSSAVSARADADAAGCC